MAGIDMAGIKVIHKVFGEGTVKALSGGYITVQFEIGEKQFTYPKAFDGFLSTEDPGLLADLEEWKRIELEKKARFEEAARQAELKRQEEKARQEELARAAAEARRKNDAVRERPVIRNHGAEGSNIAVKCNFCDGGSSDECVGFRDVCSDECIRYNIEHAKHVWCSTDSQCRKYYDGKITRKEIDMVFSCYESKMLVDWKCYAGVIRNGYDSGRPMKLLNVKKDRLAVLTTRDPDTNDRARYIFAVFLIDEYFEGDGKDEGYVQCHSKWHIELKPDEAHQMLFWNYYVNQNAPERIVFGSGLHRYLSDIKAAQILRDIVRVKKDSEGKAFAEEFFAYFSRLAGIDVNSLPEPRGALRLGS